MKVKAAKEFKPLLAALLLCSLFIQGCGEEIKEEIDPGIQQMSLNLEAVDKDFVPKPMTTNNVAPSTVNQKADDICNEDGDDFFNCQPKLLKFYIKTSKDVFTFSRHLIIQTASSLGKVPDNFSGQFHSDKDDLDIHFNKRSSLDFDLLLRQKGQSVGLISSKANAYHIQLNLDILSAKDPDSKGGIMDIYVTFTNGSKWTTDITIVGTHCDPTDVKAPETLRIKVNREQDLWRGHSTIYNGVAGQFNTAPSCDTPSSNDIGLVTYTEFVSSRQVVRSAMYFMKQKELSATNIDQFGVNSLCSNYSDLCHDLGLSIGLPAETATSGVTSLLSQYKNPYCVSAGSDTVNWNSDCSSSSPDLAKEPYSDTNEFFSPIEFSGLAIELPESL